MSLFRNLVALIQRFSSARVDASVLVIEVEHDDIHKRNVLRDFSPKLRNELVQGLESILFKLWLRVR